MSYDERDRELARQLLHPEPVELEELRAAALKHGQQLHRMLMLANGTDQDEELIELTTESGRELDEVCVRAFAAKRRGHDFADGDRVDQHEQIASWQTASGLMVGGDPSGVTPEMLAQHVGETDYLMREFAKRVQHDHRCFAAHNDGVDCQCGLGALMQRFQKLPPESM